MSRESEQRLADWAKWFHEHRLDGGDVHKKIQFLEKSVDGLLEMVCRCLEDIRDLEGRPREALGRKLWTPSGMTVAGDVRRFG